MASVHFRPAARRDLIAHAVYLVENAGEKTAERFLYQAEASFETLATQPMIGAPLTLRHPALTGLRKWRVGGFDNYLVFYLPRPDGVSVVRVLHAAQDWWHLLGIEGG